MCMPQHENPFVRLTPRDINVYSGQPFRIPKWIFVRLAFVLCSTVLAVNVDWQIQSPVSFGKVAHLNCKISDPNFNCSRQLRQWLGGEHYGSLCYENKCNASEKKYNIVQTENMCVYTLMIERFSEHDVNCEYTCSYGIWRKRKHLTLDEMKFIYTPDHNDVKQKFAVTVNNTMKQNIKISKVYPTPICFAVFNLMIKIPFVPSGDPFICQSPCHSGGFTRIPADRPGKNITDVMHISRKNIGIFFAVELDINHRVQPCSGNLTVSCYIGNVKINIPNRSFDNCKEAYGNSNDAAIIGILIGAGLFILLVICCICFTRKRQRLCQTHLKKQYRNEKHYFFQDRTTNQIVF